MLHKDNDSNNTSNAQTTEALKLLNELPIGDDTTKQLYQLARSDQLNAILADATSSRHQIAKELLSLIMVNSDLLIQETLTKRTAFSQAIVEDHRATVNEMLSIMKTCKDDFFIRQLFMVKDCNGNTALHLAVNAMNDTLIKEILEKDKDRTIYFSPNKEGLFSIALAFKNYKENRAFLPLSIINQLYFSLASSEHRTQAAEKKVKMEPWILKKPLWRHVLYMCAMRNNEGKINHIDLNLWDYITQVINNKLTVWGFNVTKELIYNYSEEYSYTPGEMLKPADDKRLAGLAGRTLNQAGTNNTLARNKKFMQMAQLGEANYSLCFITDNNSISMDDFLKINSVRLPKNAIMALVGDNLFYIQSQEESNESRSFKKIEYSELSENQKVRFESLKKCIQTLIPYQVTSAPDKVVVDIIRLVPLIKTTNDNAAKLADNKASKQLRGIGMGFLGKLTTTKASDTYVPLEDFVQNNGPR